MTDDANQGSEQVLHPDIATIRKEYDGNIILRIRKSSFEEMFFGFLGKKESLSKRYVNEFIVDKDSILQFHHLLIQKTEKEQLISLSAVTSTFQYDDGTNRTINTIDALEKYNEYKDVGVLSIDISWVFVFVSPDGSNVSQQKVSLFFNSSADSPSRSLIQVKVEHTNQVWANEVILLFEEQIKKIIIRYSSVYRLLQALQGIGVLRMAHKVLFPIAFTVIILGAIYIGIQRISFLNPITVKEEFGFDIADILSADNNYNDPVLWLQFFLIKDLQNNDVNVITHLDKKGFFHPKYESIIDKLESRYYKSEKPSKKLSYLAKSIQNEIEARTNIASTLKYLIIPYIYFFIGIIATIYLSLFKAKSVFDITSKGNRQLVNQRKNKSVKLQLAFGLLSSVAGAIVYEILYKIVLLK